MVAIHQELKRLTGPEQRSWISQGRRRSSLLSESPPGSPEQLPVPQWVLAAL